MTRPPAAALPPTAPGLLPEANTGPGPKPHRGPPVPVVPSDQVLRGLKEVDIAHNGRLYRLQVTKQGKLILTK